MLPKWLLSTTIHWSEKKHGWTRNDTSTDGLICVSPVRSRFYDIKSSLANGLLFWTRQNHRRPSWSSTAPSSPELRDASWSQYSKENTPIFHLLWSMLFPVDLTLTARANARFLPHRFTSLTNFVNNSLSVRFFLLLLLLLSWVRFPLLKRST
jgi:hypothetical protein